MPAPIRLTRRYAADSERVFAAWLEPDVAGRWLFSTAARPLAEVVIDARPGGAFRLLERTPDGATRYAGTFDVLDAPRRLAFTLHGADARNAGTRVTVDIAPRRGGCTLALVHEGLAQHDAARMHARWTGMLYGLAETLSREAA